MRKRNPPARLYPWQRAKYKQCPETRLPGTFEVPDRPERQNRMMAARTEDEVRNAIGSAMRAIVRALDSHFEVEGSPLEILSRGKASE